MTGARSHSHSCAHTHTLRERETETERGRKRRVIYSDTHTQVLPSENFTLWQLRVIFRLNVQTKVPEAVSLSSFIISSMMDSVHRIILDRISRIECKWERKLCMRDFLGAFLPYEKLCWGKTSVIFQREELWGSKTHNSGYILTKHKLSFFRLVL